jgi:uncharacterized protein
MIGRPDDLTLRRILTETRTIAVVGASDKPTRPSNEIYSYLLATGRYQVYPVNPMIRRFDDLPAVLTETLALPQRPKTLWLQEGLWHEQVGRDADEAGMQVVMDRCLMVEHARLC